MKTKILISILGVAAAVFSTASCDNKQTTEDDNKEYALELANPTDAEIFVNDSHTNAISVGLKLVNLTIDQVTVTATENEGDWCSAEISSETDAVIITPGANDTGKDKTASFAIGAAVGDIAPVVIKVTSTGKETEIYVEVESEQISEDNYGALTFNPSVAGEELKVTVRTNAEKWYLIDMNMVIDENFNPVEWYTADKISGRNGETCTIVFSANAGTEDRRTSLMFVEDPEGYSMSPITVTQSAKPATFVKVSVYDDNYNLVPVEGKTVDVNFSKEAAAWDGFDFELEKDGSIDFLFVKPGTLEADTTIEGADSPWMSISAAYGYSIVPSSNDTGTDRSVDLVIFPAGNKSTELFRFKITQTGE